MSCSLGSNMPIVVRTMFTDARASDNRNQFRIVHMWQVIDFQKQTLAPKDVCNKDVTRMSYFRQITAKTVDIADRLSILLT